MLTTILVSAVILYGAVAGAMFFGQDKLLFLPNMPGRELSASPENIGREYRNLEIPTADGETLHGWLLPNPQSDVLLLFFHGNAGNISHRLESGEIFYRLGLNVLIVDYRGYGQSTGKPSEEGLYKDADAVWRFATDELEFAPRNIAIFGRSMGGSVAAWLAAQKSPGALIVESTFTSAPDLAAKLYPFLPVRLLARLDLNTRESIRSTTSPVLVLHSRDDEIVPYEHGVALYESAAEPKAFFEMRGGHNDGFLVSQAGYTRALADFLSASFPSYQE